MDGMYQIVEVDLPDATKARCNSESCHDNPIAKHALHMPTRASANRPRTSLRDTRSDVSDVAIATSHPFPIARVS